MVVRRISIDDPKLTTERIDLIERYGSGRTLLAKSVRPPRPARPAGDRAGLGWIPVLSASTALGLGLVVWGDALSRETRSSNQALFWGGLLVIYAPIVFRLASAAVGRTERLSLVVLLGLALYLVKIFFAPFGFMFGDELAHEPNVNAILRTHDLFTANSILPITRLYPGLESVTAGLASMSGLTAFGAGLIVVGVSRIIMMLALFLIFERLSGSSRTAAVGTAVYAANSNFVFFDAQFAYESLALPLLLVALVAVLEWRTERNATNWGIVVVLLTITIVATHHVTSYALTALLIGICVAYVLVERDRLAEAPWRFALFALVATTVWLFAVARPTLGYLLPVLKGAVTSTIHTVSGQTAPRALFTNTGYQPSVLERLVGLAWILLPLGLFPRGLRALRRSRRIDPVAVVLAAAGVGFFATIILRYAPAAWETANRASEFLFIGVGFVVALAGIEQSLARHGPRAGTAVAAGIFSVMFAGGVIAGWIPQLRLAQPYRIEAGGHAIDAEGRQLASFANSHFVAGTRFAASDADARLLASYANAYAIAGGNPDVYDILRSSDFPSWQRELLSTNRIRFIVVDRRERSYDNTSGYYFGVPGRFGLTDTLRSPAAAEKLGKAGLSRLFDSGNIAIYERGSR